MNIKTAILILLSAWATISFAQTDSSLHKEKYTIQYPKTWSIDTSHAMGTDLFIFSATEDSADRFRENINIIVQDMTGKNIGLEDYKSISETQIMDMATEGIIYESDIVIDDKGEYYKMMYGMTQGKARLKLKAYCYIKDETAFLITFTSEESKYDKFKEVSDHILNSFALTK